MKKLPRFMTSGHEVSQFEDDLRKSMYPPRLREDWKQAEVFFEETRDDLILRVNGHEVMAAYQKPYMEKLADIVTRDGGNILNIGYGLGIIDNKIEELRASRDIKQHYIIELNSSIAEIAKKKHPNSNIINMSWEEAIESLPKDYFNGIVYDGYPLDVTQIHRDGIIFLDKMMDQRILKKGGTATFFVDAVSDVSDEFKNFLGEIGFSEAEFEHVKICPPERKRQHWHHPHFIAPLLRF